MYTLTLLWDTRIVVTTNSTIHTNTIVGHTNTTEVGHTNSRHATVHVCVSGAPRSRLNRRSSSDSRSVSEG